MDEIKAITIADDEAYLRQISMPVDLNDNDLKSDIETLQRYCEQHSELLALAAVQIKIPKRLIYLKKTNLDVINRELKVKILWKTNIIMKLEY